MYNFQAGLNHSISLGNEEINQAEKEERKSNMQAAKQVDLRYTVCLLNSSPLTALCQTEIPRIIPVKLACYIIF